MDVSRTSPSRWAARQQVAAVERQVQGDRPVVGAQSLADRGDHLVEVLMRQGRDAHAALVELGQITGARTGHVGLVEDQQLGHVSASISRRTSRTAAICASASSLEPSTTCTSRSASWTDLSVLMKAFDEFVRQVRDESDGVGEEDGLAAGQLALAGAGVERAKSRSSASTPASVRAFSMDDLPALV
jgi:hypothetical protein